MTNVRMTVHEALREVKSLNKRIDAAINSFTPVISTPAVDKKIGSQTIAEWEAAQLSTYQSITDMIARREALKNEIALSNARTMIEVTALGKTISVAAAIDMLSAGFGARLSLAQRLTGIYKLQENRMNTNNEDARRAAAAQVKVAMQNNGDKNSKEAPSYFSEIENNFYEVRKHELRDPIKAMIKAGDIIKNVEEATAEIDAKLSVSNATTILEFSY